jgi:hypothetical protein
MNQNISEPDNFIPVLNRLIRINVFYPFYCFSNNAKLSFYCTFCFQVNHVLFKKISCADEFMYKIYAIYDINIQLNFPIHRI